MHHQTLSLINECITHHYCTETLCFPNPPKSQALLHARANPLNVHSCTALCVHLGHPSIGKQAESSGHASNPLCCR